MRNASTFLTFILKIYAHKTKINILLEMIRMVQDIVRVLCNFKMSKSCKMWNELSSFGSLIALSKKCCYLLRKYKSGPETPFLSLVIEHSWEFRTFHFPVVTEKRRELTGVCFIVKNQSEDEAKREQDSNMQWW